MARLFEAVFSLRSRGLYLWRCRRGHDGRGRLINIEPIGGRGLDGLVAWRLLVLNPARGSLGSVCWMAGFSYLV